jgi:predicted transcriptional regulator
MDYDNTSIQSDYNVNFDWIEDVVREMGDSDEILINKNREKRDFDLGQRGWTKNRY